MNEPNKPNSPTTETPHHKLVVTREFDAPRDLVWQAWTDPAHTKAWLSLSEDSTVGSVSMDLRVGGKFRIQMKVENGEYYTAAGTYLEVQPPERLVYTWDWEKDGSGEEFGEVEGKETRITVEFRELENRTQFILTHEKFTSAQSRDNNQKGWGELTDRLEKYLSTNPKI